MLHLKRRYTHPGDIVKSIGKAELKGARVLFINMPIREQAVPNNPPMGPALLAARLLQFDVDVKIIDLNSYRIKDEIAEERGLENGRCLSIEEVTSLLADCLRSPDLVGLSGLITTLRWQSEVAKVVHNLFPRAVIASGGGLATEFRETLFDWIPELNAIAHSEGDDVIVKMAYDAKVIRDQGLFYAMESGKLEPYLVDVVDGKPLFSYDGGRPKDLNSVPFPAWNLLERDVLDRYIAAPVWGGGAKNSSSTSFSMQRSLSMISSRGCPFACKFCFRGAQGERNYGVRSAESVANEMLWLYEEYGVDFVGIVDDNFMVQRKRIFDLAGVMKPILEMTGLRWGTHGRLDEAADLRPGGKQHLPLRVDAMREAGCVYIGFGAESASPAVLEAMGKGGFILANGTTNINGYKLPTTMVEGVRNTKAAGIHGNCTWIMAYPGETLRDLQDSVAFIKWQEELYTEGLTPGTEEYSIAKDSVNKCMFVATAYPGTEMFKHEIVQKHLGRDWGIKFDRLGNPQPDENLRQYVLELNDATKVLVDRENKPLNYSAMSQDIFLEARDYIDSGDIFKILEM